MRAPLAPQTRVTPPTVAAAGRTRAGAAPEPDAVSIDNLTEDAQPAPVQLRARIEDGVEFLRVRLADGPVPAVEIKRDARAAGISVATLRRAQRRLGVLAIKVGRDRWDWRLPDGAQPEGAQPEDAQLEDAQLEGGQLEGAQSEGAQSEGGQSEGGQSPAAIIDELLARFGWERVPERDMQPAPCRNCRGRRFSRHKGGGPFVCDRCHPIHPEMIAERYEVAEPLDASATPPQPAAHPRTRAGANGETPLSAKSLGPGMTPADERATVGGLVNTALDEDAS